MKRKQICLFVLLNLMMFKGVYAAGMCKKNETVIFNCDLKKSVSSLCKMEKNGTLAYRNGAEEKNDLEVSGDGPDQHSVFYFSNIAYAGGGEAHIRFSRGGYSYYLYDKTVKADEGVNFSAGIVVYRGNKKISNVICQNDASIHQQAYTDIAKEVYKNIDSK